MTIHNTSPTRKRTAVETMFETVSNEARLYRRLVGARIRSDWQFRTSFFSLALAQMFFLASDVAAVVILVSLVDRLGGWTAPQVLFLFGLATLPFAIADVFIGMIDTLANKYIQPGQFDTILLRPSSALLQVMALEFELRRAAKLVPPAAALAWAIPNLDIGWTLGRTGLVIAALICGTAIYAGLWVIATSITFWAVASREATNALTYGSQFANQYPLHVYPGWIRAVMGWVVPLAFVAYIPTLFAAETTNPLSLPTWSIYTPPLVAVTVLFVARFVWKTGVEHYQSTGS